VQSSKNNYVKNAKSKPRFDDGYSDVSCTKKKVSRSKEKFDKRNFGYNLETK
jgi:hypothetical protein